MIAVRVVLVVLAAAAIAWLATGVAASRAQDELRDLVNDTERPTAEQIRRAHELRREAERGTPGQRAALIEATLLLKGDDAAGARRVLEQAVRAEPENAEAWLLLARATEDDDPARSEQARARVHALAPDVPPP
jgi:predicted Zn-dependent protease